MGNNFSITWNRIIFNLNSKFMTLNLINMCFTLVFFSLHPLHMINVIYFVQRSHVEHHHSSFISMQNNFSSTSSVSTFILLFSYYLFNYKKNDALNISMDNDEFFLFHNCYDISLSWIQLRNNSNYGIFCHRSFIIRIKWSHSVGPMLLYFVR